MSTAERRRAVPFQEVRQWEEGSRIDSADKVTGRAEYIADIPPIIGEAYAAAVRSPHSHARIVRVDCSRALALEGVLAVVDRDHADGIDLTITTSEYAEEHHGAKATVRDQGIIAIDKARFDGDLVAVVVGVDQETACRGAELVQVDYELLPPVYSFEEATADGAVLVHEDLENNTAFEDSLEWGDVDRGFEDAEQIFEAEWFGGNVYHHPIEPSSSGIVDFRGKKLDVWAGTHKPLGARKLFAEVFDLDEDDVRVKVPPIGGGFGAKQITPPLVAAAIVSRKLGRPVRYIATEADSFRSTSRHAITYHARVGVKNDGTITALDVRLDIDTGAYFTGAGLVTHNACISAWGCYRIPHFRVYAKAVYTNKVPAASFRATGKNQTTFGVESMLDLVAHELGMAPSELKAHNALQRGEYVTDVWKVRGEEFVADTPPMDTDYTELIGAAVQGIGWDGKEPGDGGVSSDGGSRVRGRGLGLSLRHSAQQGGRAYALVTVGQDEVLSVHHNGPDLGTGVYNMLAVVCAQTLGVDLKTVRVLDPDTQNQMPFGGTSAQRTTVQLGNAAKMACERLIEEACAAVSIAAGGAPEEWTHRAGRVERGDESYSLGEVCKLFRGDVRLRAIGSYSYAPSVDKAFHGLDGWAPGAAAAEVEVDLETGEVKILQYSVVGDAGRTIHAMSSRRQLEGGVILGLGGTMLEELVYEGDRLTNAHPLLYPMPRMQDVPPFTVHMVENGDGPGPFGAKGLAQTSLPCVAPAVGAAIRDAIGTYVRATPFTPERVLQTLGRFNTEDQS